MRRLFVAALVVGCHRDLSVDPCAHEPALCDETGSGDTGANTGDTGASTGDTVAIDSGVEDDTGVVESDTGALETGIADATTDSATADSTSSDSATMDTAPADTCVCMPGKTEAVAGACPGVLEKKSRTCTAACVWGAETCALPKGWTAIADAPATFEGRVYAAPVWTGGELIVFGGARSIEGGVPFGDGAMYRLSSNSWTAVASSGAPTARIYHSAVWDGRNYIVWGGRNGSTYLADGASFDSLLKTWTALPSSPLSGRNAHGAVWAATTKQLLVWGGQGATTDFADGAAYDPSTASWTALPAAPVTKRRSAFTAWTGSEMLIWGGRDDAGPLADGALYDPVKKTWRTIPATSIGTRFGVAAQVVGDRLFAFGGVVSDAASADGQVLSLGSLTWSAVASPSAATYEPRMNVVTWPIGETFHVWSGLKSDAAGMPVFLTTGAAHDFKAGAWSAMSTSGAPLGRIYAATAPIANGAIVWGGLGKPSGGAVDALKDGAIYVQ